ncbi:MAG: hypothetical protein WBV73_08565 [Phormidium sp.]
MDKISFASETFELHESGKITYPVTLTRVGDGIGAVTAEVKLTSSTRIGRATVSKDYELPSVTVSWADGDTEPHIADLKIIQDFDESEGIERVNLSFGTITNGVKGAIVTAIAIIQTSSEESATSIPAHQWMGTSLKFQNPDSSWGEPVNLKGERGERGDKGDRGDSGSGVSGSEKILFMETDANPLTSEFLDMENPLLTIYRVSVSSPARIRAYLSTESRELDLGRPTSLMPANSEYNNPGILFDLVLGVNGKSDLDFRLSPQVLASKQKLFFNLENLQQSPTKINLAILGLE